MMKAVLLTLTAVVLVSAPAGAASAQEGYEEVPPEVLVMKFKPLSGRAPVTLTGPRSRVTVLLIWASWCAVCRDATEGLSGMAGELRGLGAEVVGLTTENPDDGGAPADFAARRKLKFRSGWGEREALLELFGERTSIPLILVFNQDGYITGRLVGYKEATQVHVRRAVKRALRIP